MTETRTRRRDTFMTRTLVPGVRLHLLRTDRFTTSYCRVVLHRDLGPEATATAVLGQVLQSATARHPTRAALAHRLADLYGAALSIAAGKLGDRQVLSGSLEWPTNHVPRARGVLGAGLGLLREVWSDPKRGDDADLDPELVQTEKVNHVRMLQSRSNDKARYALRECIARACAGEPFGLDSQGTVEDVAAITPATLATLHERLLSRAPMEIFLVGDLTLRDAQRAVRDHLLWPRAARSARIPSAASVHPPRARARKHVERQPVTQGKLVFAYRGAIGPKSAAAPAAETLAGVLGGGAYARLFRVVREEHGLCYYASAAWHRAKGLMIVQTGIDPSKESKVRRLVASLTKEVAGGALEPTSLDGFRKDLGHRVAALRDSPRAMVNWYQQGLALGLDPSPHTWLRSLERVTPDAVRRAGSKLALDTTFYLAPEQV